MYYSDAVVVLEGMIKALESHIELAKKGLIQEDCIGCREKDLETYKGILEILEKEHGYRNGWQSRTMEYQLKIDHLNNILAIIKSKGVDSDLFWGCLSSTNPRETYNNSIKPLNSKGLLSQWEFDLLRTIYE